MYEVLCRPFGTERTRSYFHPQHLQQLGVPDKQITVDGVQYLAYDRQRQEINGAPYG
jgi:hypothetical protein